MGNDRHQAISERAYFIWRAEGCPPGKELEHWLRAEAELSAQKYAGVTNSGKFILHSEVAALPKPRRQCSSD